ncbi:phage tail spike protein, partial [Streptococcus marmotae]
MSYPILYAANETNFKHLGVSVLSDASKCLVTRERNGLYFLEMEYPIDGKDFKKIKKDMIIRVDAGYRTKKQRFVVSKITDKMNGYAEIYCRHIAIERISKNALRPNVTVVGTGASALEMWRQNLIDSSVDFATWSNVTTQGSASWEIENYENAYQVLGGKAGSILDVWGGEYEFDNLTIKLWDSLGRKTSNIIAYGRNLLDLEQEDEILSTYTSVYPFAKKTEGETEQLIVLSEGIVDSPHVDKYAKRKILKLDLSSDENIKSEDQLRKAAQRYIKSNRVGVPKTKLTIKYQDLSKVHGIFDNEVLEETDLCDKVKVYYEDLGIANDEAKVTKVVWNVLLDENEEIEVGDSRSNFSDSLGISSAVESGIRQGTSGMKSDFDRLIEEQIAVWNRRFEEEREKIEDSVKEGIEQAKAKAEQTKAELAEEIEEKLAEQGAEAKKLLETFQSSDLDKLRKQIEETSETARVNAELIGG